MRSSGLLLCESRMTCEPPPPASITQHPHAAAAVGSLAAWPPRPPPRPYPGTPLEPGDLTCGRACTGCASSGRRCQWSRSTCRCGRVQAVCAVRRVRRPYQKAAHSMLSGLNEVHAKPNKPIQSRGYGGLMLGSPSWVDQLALPGSNPCLQGFAYICVSAVCAVCRVRRALCVGGPAWVGACAHRRGRARLALLCATHAARGLGSCRAPWQAGPETQTSAGCLAVRVRLVKQSILQRSPCAALW